MHIGELSGFRGEGHAAVFEFKRRGRETADAAKDRILRRLSGAESEDLEWLEASLIAHDGEQWEPGLSDKGPPDISAIEIGPLVEEVADYIAG